MTTKSVSVNLASVSDRGRLKGYIDMAPRLIDVGLGALTDDCRRLLLELLDFLDEHDPKVAPKTGAAE